jgi:hypothetical protein
MKQLLLLILLSIAFISVEAQTGGKKSRFAFISIAYDGTDEMYYVRIDSGQAPISKKGPIMTDRFGQVIKFISPAAALNYVENGGWKLVEVLHNTEGSSSLGTGSIGTTLSYLFRKDY